ncbi:MAG: phosphodiester glycosidase family protein [Cyanobium sp.]
MLKPPVGFAAICALIAAWPIPLSAGPGPRLQQLPPPPPPLPPTPSQPPTPAASLSQGIPLPASDQPPFLRGGNGTLPANGVWEGRILSIHGQRQRAHWLWVGSSQQVPRELWLPLEVLQGQLGFTSRNKGDGALELEWFGRLLFVPQSRQRSLADEVAIDVAPFLAPGGLSAQVNGAELRLQGGMAQVRQVRASTSPPGSRRVVLDLTGPAVVRSGDGRLWLAAEVPAPLTQELLRFGLTGRRDGEGWALAASATPQRVFTLGEPSRVVIDLPGSGESAAVSPGAPPRAPLDPRLQALLGSQVFWSKDVPSFAGRRFRLNSVRMDPLNSSLELRNLSRGTGMEGLTTLPLLARRYDALVAINGGYFNRVRRLPLGALRDQGQWLSGPILNRGVVAWEGGALPRFGRLTLQEWVDDGTLRQWPVEFVNSGYVKRGLARYTVAWGRQYRALSGSEQALLLRDSVVQRRYDSAWLAAGVPLGPGEELLVARGIPLPWAVGTRLQLASRPTSDLGLATNVMGGGPLLLQGGRVVLDGPAEGFSAAFLSQGAPRTVIGSDGRFLWLLTLEGVDDEGPTLAETARLLQAAGLQDALNLDGGSSTGLVMGGLHTVKGRGVVSAVHNGLGLVPKTIERVSADLSGQSPPAALLPN